MKRILPILLLAALSGCSLSSADTAARKIGSGVSRCCAASLALSKNCPLNFQNNACPEQPPLAVSLVERSGEILTW